MSDDNAEYNLVLPFLTNDPQFTLGVEVGMLWEQLQAEPSEHEVTIHAANDEQVIVMASRLGYRLTLESLADGWKTARFEKLFTIA